MLIIRRSNYINTASDIVTLCRWPSGMHVEKELKEFLLNLHAGRPPTDSDYTSCCINTIWPPDDEHNVDRNM